MALVGKKAPAISAKAVFKNRFLEDFSLNQFVGQYIVFFFYPLNFTFVCPTELHAFQERLQEFEKRNAQVIGCSVDSCFSHAAWLNISKELGGIQGITYPLVSDLNKTISKSFGVLKEEDGIAYRGLFLINREGVICHETINDLPIGRSVDEVLRTLDALIFHEKHGEVCPANWKSGAKAMKPTDQGLVEYFNSK
ncbi:MAG TPA: peroxiredoxin [Chlamydiales bacterium]|nr:peroxiredoxin [Chlamydiales bacterium]